MIQSAIFEYQIDPQKEEEKAKKNTTEDYSVIYYWHTQTHIKRDVYLCVNRAMTSMSIEQWQTKKKQQIHNIKKQFVRLHAKKEDE